MLHITEEQAREALSMQRAIELVEESFRRLDDGRAVNLPRRRVFLENRAILHAMEAGDDTSGLFAAKLYVTRPGAGATFVIALFDAQSTSLLALVDANALGQIRTGAASGVATKILAPDDVKTVGLIGSGFQAETQLEAIALARKLDRALVYSRSPERCEAFAKKMSDRLKLAVQPVEEPEAAAGCDIVVTITSSKEPVLLGEWLAPGCHVNAAGSNHRKRRELDAAAVIKAGLIVTDSIEQARVESGDLIQAIDEGVTSWDQVAELGGILTGRLRSRKSDAEITIFESQGLAVQDLIVAEEVYRAAADRPI